MLKKISPINYVLILLVTSIVTHFFIPIKEVIPTPYNLTGSLLTGLGVFINIWADQLFRIENTTVKPNKTPSVLVTSGPYRFSQHPMYLGMTFILLGTSILLGSITAFIKCCDRSK